jgi:catechol 2,3-dioxygenase-like lactoylglutathione lyase family enzyme
LYTEHRLTEKYDRSILSSVSIDHLTIPVRDYETSKRFYELALRPLGFAVLLDWPDRRRAYLGVEESPSSLWLAESYAAGSLEVSLAAEQAEMVDAFYAAALAAGGLEQDEPGVRAEHSRDYYAARVRDPDGNSVEAVYRGAAAAEGLRHPVAA